MVLGVTGKYCAGKSAVTELLAGCGWHTIDVDSLGHVALQQKRQEVLQRFGRELDDGVGSIDRKRLGAIVFRNRTALRYLESILHPAMVAMVDEELAAREGVSVAINAALLYPMGLAERCDRVVWVKAGFWSRFRRARLRDGIGLAEMIRRERAQKRISPQFYRVDVDIVTVENRGDPAALERSVKQIAAQSEAKQ